jgi:hypothetical protein
VTVFEVAIYPVGGKGQTDPAEVIEPIWGDCRDLLRDPRFQDVSHDAGYLDYEAILDCDELSVLHETRSARAREWVRTGVLPAEMVRRADEAIARACDDAGESMQFRVLVSEHEP